MSVLDPHKECLFAGQSDRRNELDRQIIMATQAGLPVVAHPYQQIADELNVPVEVVMQRLNMMKQDGRIRRIAAVPDHYKLGFTANAMSVWDVDDEKVDELGEKIGALDIVSHCYRRPRALPEWPYNLFAMVHGSTRDDVLGRVGEIAQQIGDAARQYDILFSTRILKKTGLRLVDKN